MNEIIEKVVNYFDSNESFSQQLIKGKEEYFNKTGRVFEDDPFYEARLKAFVEWFALDRRVPEVGLSPVEIFFRIHEKVLVAEEVDSFNSAIQSIHSLFALKSVSGTEITIRDLFDDSIYAVFDQQQYSGLQKGSYFEARIFSLNGKRYFSETFILHPQEANKLIEKRSKENNFKHRSEFLEFILELANLKLRCDRYRKVDVERIYATGERGEKLSLPDNFLK